MGEPKRVQTHPILSTRARTRAGMKVVVVGSGTVTEYIIKYCTGYWTGHRSLHSRWYTAIYSIWSKIPYYSFYTVGVSEQVVSNTDSKALCLLEG